MDRTSYGSTAEAISKLTDPAQLQQMLKNPAYAGYTGVIIARISELNHIRQAAQAQQAAPPTVAQQALSGQAPPQSQAMAAGGIVAFKHGGKVRKYAAGGEVDPVPPFWDTVLGEWAHPIETIGKRYIANYKPSPKKAAPQPVTEEPVKYVESPAPKVEPKPEPVNPRDLAPIGLPDMGSSGIIALGGRSRKGHDYGTDSDAIYRRIQARIGSNPDVEAERAALAQDRDRNPHMAMIRAGLGMAQSASTNPHYGILGNAAVGAGEGLTDYMRGQEEQNKHLSELAKISRQERLGASTQAEQEYAANIRAQAQEEGANARAAMMTGGQNKQFVLENQLALRAANEMKQNDIKLHGRPTRSDMDYLEAGRARFVSGIRNADLMAGSRADLAAGAQVNARYNNLIKAHPDWSPQYAWQMAQVDDSGAPAPSGGQNYGSLE